mmetsp:Transcript_148931/g.478527  ORF Transcript_148931/g.478527 Transcript_148931/m.478527 type:complete len:411 (+) Transcript_148931:595-1827(+)
MRASEGEASEPARPQLQAPTNLDVEAPSHQHLRHQCALPRLCQQRPRAMSAPLRRCAPQLSLRGPPYTRSQGSREPAPVPLCLQLAKGLEGRLHEPPAPPLHEARPPCPSLSGGAGGAAPVRECGRGEAEGPLAEPGVHLRAAVPEAAQALPGLPARAHGLGPPPKPQGLVLVRPSGDGARRPPRGPSDPNRNPAPDAQPPPRHSREAAPDSEHSACLRSLAARRAPPCLAPPKAERGEGGECLGAAPAANPCIEVPQNYRETPVRDPGKKRQLHAAACRPAARLARSDVREPAARPQPERPAQSKLRDLARDFALPTQYFQKACPRAPRHQELARRCDLRVQMRAPHLLFFKRRPPPTEQDGGLRPARPRLPEQSTLLHRLGATRAHLPKAPSHGNRRGPQLQRPRGAQ